MNRFSARITAAGRSNRGRHLFNIPGNFPAPLFAFLTAVLDVLLRRYLGSDLADDPTFLDLLERGGTNPASYEALVILSDVLEEADNAEYDLVFAFKESEQGLTGSCAYNADQFEDAQARALTKHFAALLKEAAAKPGARISTFEMLDAAEKHRLLVEWNGEERGYPPHCVHELFEQQVERKPDSTAAVFEGERVTYSELNRQANRLAHYLRRFGAGTEVMIGILMNPSLEAVVAVYAVLKAGGAYVALHHNHPPLRLREIIRESGLSVVVTISSNAGYQALAGEAVEFVCVDLAASRIAEESASNPRSGVTPDNMVSVRYTSGSTGKPKGAVNIHRVFTSRLILPLREIVETDVCLVNISWGFAIRLFYPLALGATVVIASEKELKDVNRLADSLERDGITSMFMVPSHLRQLLSGGTDLARRLGRLRAVAVGGETLTRDLAVRFLELLPHVQLFNTYGGSETGVVAVQPVTGDSLSAGNAIGRPVVNTRVYLLDRDMNLVPPGVVGEMYVGSEHLGRGYLHRPDLTALQYVRDPFGAGRLYRTGDLGRHMPDGTLEFLGRADRQVRVRGLRVELEEIEGVLHDCEQVHEAVVTAQENGGDKRLVAYVVPQAGASPGVSGLRDFLRQRLPDYMVPAAFVFVERMPLQPNGKIDIRALPAPGRERPRLDNDWEGPRNAVEAAIAEIWSGVLGVENIGINDNFIELGGDSLLATSASGRIRNRLGVKVPMELILEWSIATIAAELDAASG